MYNILAKYYDKLMKEDYNYREWADYVLAFIGDRKRGLDLACGTGNITKEFVDKGKAVTGLDISADMLSIARKKLPRTRFFLGNMENLNISGEYDFITCCCDGVNYIKQDGLTSFFTKVRAKLTNGGMFAFDISSEYKLKNIIGSNVFYNLGDEVNMYWLNDLVDDAFGGCIEMELHFYSKTKSSEYSLHTDKQKQYIHNVDRVISSLSSAGFSSVDCYGFCTQRKPEAKDTRIQFTAK
ncbi:MAG: class I SAM-dependent methyltransferase [Clostridia bacterium]|nr:class I SAM-dependent methyltransferase [Clostridia bacterium]